MIKAIAIDDEPIALKVIENFCNEIETITLEKTFGNAEEGLKYLKKFPTDIIFLDIEMPNINGIDFPKSGLYVRMWRRENTLFVLFTNTSSDDVYKFMGFEKFGQACLYRIFKID